MRRLDRLWLSLGSAPVLTGVRAAWGELVGPDAEVLQPLLRALPDPVTTYPCPRPGSDGCPRGVVVHGPRDIVAICRARPRRCPTLTLERKDIVAYELDTAKLCARLGKLLGLAGEGLRTPRSATRRTYYVGLYQPVAGRSFPVYLVLAAEPSAIFEIVDNLLAREPRPLLALVPAIELVPPEAVAALATRKAAAVGLPEVFAANDQGRLALADRADEALSPFRADVLDEAARATADGMVFFPTPAGATWEQLRIRFRDGHTVSVRVLGVEAVFHYSQMGMANRKNAEPTVQWKLLQAFAEDRGTLAWTSPHADRRNQKRRENLSRDLRAFFRIDGDPIALTPDGGGWRTVFELFDEV